MQIIGSPCQVQDDGWVEMAGLLSPPALPSSGVRLWQRQHESKLGGFLQILLHPDLPRSFSHPVPARTVDFGTRRNKIRQSRLEKTGRSPRQVLMDIPHWLKVSSLVSRTL